ncbi:MAG: hypothetical protein A2Y65_02890 [Deltaproteobacteria bacterium RBG_13_52_11]|nr:MAG: hypothetical protein A2Y65_02890 [Deltaproteobacteria bacterium RBG_13_52_11]
MPLAAGFKGSSENHSNMFVKPPTPWTLEPFWEKNLATVFAQRQGLFSSSASGITNLPVTYRQLNPSGASVPDFDLITFNDDGHLPGAFGVREHLLEPCGVLVDIVIHSIAVG